MHYCTFVIIGAKGDPDALVADALAPFDEMLAVTPYREYQAASPPPPWRNRERSPEDRDAGRAASTDARTSAGYPQCSLAAVEDPAVPAGWMTWCVDVQLEPELFPILRHAQFEDLLNHTFADPVSSLLRAVRPDESLWCRVENRAAPAPRRRCHAAGEAVKLLDRSFFRTHHRLAACFARHVLRGRRRPVALECGALSPLWSRAMPCGGAGGVYPLAAGEVPDREHPAAGLLAPHLSGVLVVA